MTPQAQRTLAAVVRDMILERQRLLIREANYLRGLVGLPPVKVLDESTGTARRRRPASDAASDTRS